MKRINNRRNDELRPISVTFDIFPFAAGSVLFEIGSTKVLCAVTIQNTVPPFLRGKGTGWLTAEYSLLPASTKQRTARESSSFKRSGRSVEIARLIGRTLRMSIDVVALGERTIVVDCDVLQADGGTRTASINGAYLALQKAQQRWLADGTIEKPFLIQELAAFSVGIVDGNVMLDPDYQEDSGGEADINIIMTRDSKIVEIQGGAEKTPFSWDQFEEVKNSAQKGCTTLFALYDSYETTVPQSNRNGNVPLFSLYNR